MFTNQHLFNIQQLGGVVVITVIHLQSVYSIVTQRLLSVLLCQSVDHQVRVHDYPRHLLRLMW